MIKQTLKVCAGCKRPKVIWKSNKKEKYCRDCWARKSPRAQSTPTYSPIPIKSKKKSQEDRLYNKLRLDYFLIEKNKICFAQLKNCSYHSTDVHHKKGRGPYLLKILTWIPVCRNCHNYIETHPAEARSLGLSESRLTTT